MTTAIAEAALPVRLQGVAKSFGEVRALEETSLDIRPGEFLTLLGPSGCGKTTLLNIVAGFLEPDRGEIFLGDELVTYQPVHSRGIGMVFQSYALSPSACACTACRAPSGTPGSARRWPRSRWRTTATASRASCRAASSSASPWPARWR